MNFEELSSAWATQSPAVSSAIDTTRLKHSILPEVKRRGRFLAYAIFVNVLSLVILPLITIGNYRYAPPRHPGWYWFYFSAWMLLLAVFLTLLIRRAKRHGGILEQCTHSLREFTIASLASLEADMRECRLAVWGWPAMIAFQLTNLYVNFPFAEFGWQPFGLRAAFVMGLSAVLGFVFWRHYRVNLKPAYTRQKELLEQLS